MKISFYDCEVPVSPEEVGWKNYKGMGFAVGCVVDVEVIGMADFYHNMVPLDLGLLDTISFEKQTKIEFDKELLGQKHIQTNNILTPAKFDITQHAFVEDAAGLAQHLNQSDLVIGFNSKNFDDNLIVAHAGKDQDFLLKSIDIQQELDDAADLKFITGLERACLKTLGMSKYPGIKGADVPKEWQKGNRAKVTNYCLGDCTMLARLFFFGVQYQYILTTPNKNPDLFGNMVLQLPVNWRRFIR